LKGKGRKEGFLHKGGKGKKEKGKGRGETTHTVLKAGGRGGKPFSSSFEKKIRA